MKKIYTLFLALLSASTLLLAQPSPNPNCDGMRYYTETFPNVTRTNGVQYGRNTRNGGTTINLLMDIYQPTGDTVSARPMVFVAYGGSFVAGSRTDAYVVELCNQFARHGYVAIAYDYRLYELTIATYPPDSIRMVDEVVRAVHDLRGAIRYMRNSKLNGDPYRVDTNFVMIGGISAGAILSMHAAFLDDINELPTFVRNAVVNNGGMEGTTNTHTSSSHVNGVLSLSGGLYRRNLLNGPRKVPFVAIHDNGDTVVPYAFGNASVAGSPILAMDGDFSCHNYADDMGLPNNFITVNSTGHVSYSSNTVLKDSVMRFTYRMFGDIVCEGLSGNKQPIVAGQLPARPVPAFEQVSIELPEGMNSYSVIATDILGRVVFQKNSLSDNTFTLHRDGLGKGIYFVSVMDEASGTRYLSKVIFE